MIKLKCTRWRNGWKIDKSVRFDDKDAEGINGGVKCK
jgi:hypothetical protein